MHVLHDSWFVACAVSFHMDLSENCVRSHFELRKV